ncbi:MAG TPA: cytochrome c biogenesis protein CcdC [Vicinamibacterales bacterium]|nr:cytochrome c biogenesis protein CcdC [Vicinamibacterales bacterium]
MELPLASFGAALIGTLAILAWRVRESRRPVSLRSLIIPPLGMSTGFSMFVVPAFRIPWTWGLTAFVLGALVFAYPLVSSPQLSVEDGLIMMRRSRWFLVVILALAAVRLGLRQYISSLISVQQTAGLFFVLAFGMIVRWRTTLLMEYRQLTQPLATNH